MQELYDEGREALDEDQFREAERSFTELVKLNGAQDGCGTLLDSVRAETGKERKRRRSRQSPN